MQNWGWFLLAGAITYLVTLGTAFRAYVSKNNRWERRYAPSPKLGSKYRQCALFTRDALLDLLAPEVFVFVVQMVLSLCFCSTWNRLVEQGSEQAQSGWFALILLMALDVVGSHYGQKILINWGHAKAMEARRHVGKTGDRKPATI